jgi:uncharacterized repeat protein (TIGR01451 family)
MEPKDKQPQSAPKPDETESDLSLMRRRLYAREESEEMRRREDELHRLGINRHEARSENEPGTLGQASYKHLSLLRAKRVGRVLRFTVIAGSLLLVIVAAVAAVLWYRSTQTVTQSQIELLVEGPQEFTAGDDITYAVSYANRSRVDWVNAELVVTPPRGFTFRESTRVAEQAGRQIILKVGDVASSEEGELQIRGRLIGEQNETAVAQAELFITPQNFPSGRFNQLALLATTITALPLDVSLNIPTDAASGERVLAKISVRNLSSNILAGVYLRVQPADEVQLAAEDPDFSPEFVQSGSEWLLPDLEPLEAAERTLVFYVTGRPGERRLIDIEAGIRQGEEDFVQRELTHVVTVSATEIEVEQFYNDSAGPLTVHPDETISGVVRFRNVGSVGLKEAIVRVSFAGVVFDPASLSLSGAGSYDPVTKSITWSPATVPQLAVIQPQQESELGFSFKIPPLEQFPTAGEEAKNQVLITTATVDSPDLPTPVGQPRQIISDRAVLSVGTDLILDVASFYDDGRLGITSTGPTPPKVGQTTSYTLRFRVGSTLNDVSDVRLTAVLPDGVRYTGQNYLTGGELAFNERSGELVWTLPFIQGLTGRTAPHQELHVQVAITPGEDKRGQTVALLNKVQLEAVDQFTDEAVSLSPSGTFPTTASAVPGKGTVE